MFQSTSTSSGRLSSVRGRGNGANLTQTPTTSKRRTRRGISGSRQCRQLSSSSSRRKRHKQEHSNSFEGGDSAFARSDAPSPWSQVVQLDSPDPENGTDGNASLGPVAVLPNPQHIDVMGHQVAIDESDGFLDFLHLCRAANTDFMTRQKCLGQLEVHGVLSNRNNRPWIPFKDAGFLCQRLGLDLQPLLSHVQADPPNERQNYLFLPTTLPREFEVFWWNTKPIPYMPDYQMVNVTKLFRSFGETRMLVTDSEMIKAVLGGRGVQQGSYIRVQDALRLCIDKGYDLHPIECIMSEYGVFNAPERGLKESDREENQDNVPCCEDSLVHELVPVEDHEQAADDELPNNINDGVLGAHQESSSDTTEIPDTASCGSAPEPWIMEPSHYSQSSSSSKSSHEVVPAEAVDTTSGALNTTTNETSTSRRSSDESENEELYDYCWLDPLHKFGGGSFTLHASQRAKTIRGTELQPSSEKTPSLQSFSGLGASGEHTEEFPDVCADRGIAIYMVHAQTEQSVIRTAEEDDAERDVQIQRTDRRVQISFVILGCFFRPISSPDVSS